MAAFGSCTSGDGRSESGLRLHLELTKGSATTFTCWGLGRASGVQLLHLRRNLVHPLVDPVDVVPARDAKPSQRAFDGIVDHRFEISPAPLHLVDEVTRNIERLAHVVEQCLPALLNRVRAR